jgi:hypothetical protein
MRKGVRTVKRSEPASITKEFFCRFDIHHLVVVEKKDVLSLNLRTLKANLGHKPTNRRSENAATASR